MTSRYLYIVWPNEQTVTIQLENNPAADYYYNCMMHLQHVPLLFDHRSNSLMSLQFNQLADTIQDLGNKLNVQIDPQKLSTQTYLNLLHDKYFKHATEHSVESNWLKFHDTIHLIEECVGNHSRHNQIWFDFREKAGAFVKTFDRSWLKYSVNKVEPGDCMMKEHELGKSLLAYKNDNEVLDPALLTRLAKPWHTLRPILDLYLNTTNLYQQFVETEQDEFVKWFEPYRHDWCSHWNIPDWTPQEMFAKIPLGKIDDLETLVDNFSKEYYPMYIKR